MRLIDADALLDSFRRIEKRKKQLEKLYTPSGAVEDGTDAMRLIARFSKKTTNEISIPVESKMEKGCVNDATD